MKVTSNLYISSPTNTMKIIKKYDLVLKKIYGQNFIIDTNVLKKIAGFAQLERNDVILEIGPGIGSLTEILMPEVKKVICIEIDKKFSEVFVELFGRFIGNKIVFISQDAMKADFNEICSFYSVNKVVSNLPYKIAAPVILKILGETERVKDIIVTIQKDIADRILAKPRDKNYNAATVKMNFFSEFCGSFGISKNVFYPKPHVDSETIRLRKWERFLPDSVLNKIDVLVVGDLLKNNNLKRNFRENFFKFVEDSFSHRRKKLINSLVINDRYYLDHQHEILQALTIVDKGKDIRPEELSIEDYLNVFILTSQMFKYFFNNHEGNK
ncbi:MAG: 16S rRNA (adenine(1518)-N(6)/adenine(1519)-N(6))-dimethyltransferase RsmA [Candidatus Humimicrobiaceae bacterium]